MFFVVKRNTFSSAEQPIKASAPIPVMVLGIISCFNLLQPWKANIFIVFRLESNSISSNEEQPRKACDPISFTFLVFNFFKPLL